MKVLFPSREGHFSLRRIRGIYVIRRRACSVTSERCIGELGARCLSTLNGGQDSTTTVSYGYGQPLSGNKEASPQKNRREAYNAIARPQEGGRYYTNLTYSIQEVNPEESDGSRLCMTPPAKGRSRYRRPKRGIRLAA